MRHIRHVLLQWQGMAKGADDRYEVEARWNKAWKLCRHLKDLGITNEDAARFDQAAWHATSKAAGVKPPSELTQGIVVGLLTPTPDDPRTKKQATGW